MSNHDETLFIIEYVCTYRVPMISYMQVVTVVTGGAEILIILSTPGYKRFSVDTEYSTLENRSIRRWK